MHLFAVEALGNCAELISFFPAETLKDLIVTLQMEKKRERVFHGLETSPREGYINPWNASYKYVNFHRCVRGLLNMF